MVKNLLYQSNRQSIPFVALIHGFCLGDIPFAWANVAYCKYATHWLLDLVILTEIDYIECIQYH